ncbi:MAG: hypothetical protein ACPGQS_12810 [Bradymonadia bacterium]
MKERIKTTTRLRDALPVPLRTQLISHQTKLSQLKMNWCTELPTTVQAKAQPYRIENTTLQICLNTDITPNEEEIIEKWLTDMGPGYGLKSLQLVTSGKSSADSRGVPIKSSSSAQSKTEFIEDEGLRHALATLITQIEMRRTEQ